MIYLENISVSFGTRELFKNTNFQIGNWDRIALVGNNGSGKSTLLKIIKGDIQPDTGKVVRSRHSTIGYLPQEVEWIYGNTVFEEVYSAAVDVVKIEQELEEITKELSNFEDRNSSEYLELLNEFTLLHEKLSYYDAYELRGRIEKILAGLGFVTEDYNRKIESFSGGWQMRVLLARLLVQSPSILLLDEPTNHLDMESLLWLENFLKNYKGALILVSHDKRFMDNIVKGVYEIWESNLHFYSGNYTNFLVEKARRKELLISKFENQQRYLKEQEKFIERFRYKATKARAVQSRIKMLEKIEKIEVPEDDTTIHFKFQPPLPCGKKVVELINLSKSYDGRRKILSGINFTILRGEKIALVGRNGTGKSTFARILSGVESYEGTIDLGYNVKVSLYSQKFSEALENDKTVLETVKEVASSLTEQNIRSILGCFLFSDDDVHKPVNVLSGGEKSRVALVKMIVGNSNFLIFDEPTNHLDLRSKQVLIEALKQYKGTLLLISHDRDLLEEVATKIIYIENGQVKEFVGTLAEYLSIIEKELIEQDSELSQKHINRRDGEISLTPYQRSIKEKQKRKQINVLLSPLKRRLKQVEEDLIKLESRKSEIENLMMKEDFYRDTNFVIEITTEYKEVEKSISHLTVEWEKLITEIENLKQN
ncbi:MAG: ribosomal protection-like ABC-F family protein [Ignavibacteria bacterium]